MTHMVGIETNWLKPKVASWASSSGDESFDPNPNPVSCAFVLEPAVISHGDRHTLWDVTPNGGFLKSGVITKWCIMENLIETRMIWGYPHFRKLPNGLTQAFWVLFEMYLDLAFGNPVQICSSLGVPDLCLSPRTSTFTGSTA